MRLVDLALGMSLVLPVHSGFALPRVRRGPTSHKPHTRQGSKSGLKPAPQKEMDPARASQIQAALVHSGYLSGDTSGRWDTETEAAMRRYQAANGWQTKLTPDSRAIIKLGLGPSDIMTLRGSPSSMESQ